MCETIKIQLRAKELALIFHRDWSRRSGWVQPSGNKWSFFTEALQLGQGINTVLQQFNQAFDAKKQCDRKLEPGNLHQKWQKELLQNIVDTIKKTAALPEGKRAVDLAEAVALCCVMKGLAKRQMKELQANVETLIARVLYRGEAPGKLEFLKPRLYRAASRHDGLKPCKEVLVACLELLKIGDYQDEDIKRFAQFVQAIREFFEFYEGVTPRSGGS